MHFFTLTMSQSNKPHDLRSDTKLSYDDFNPEDFARIVLKFHWPREYTAKNCYHDEWCQIAKQGWKALSLDTICGRIVFDHCLLGDLAYCTLYSHPEHRPDISQLFYEVAKKWLNCSKELMMKSLGLEEVFTMPVALPDDQKSSR